MTWTLEQAVALCRRIETIAPEFDCHVALTGGVLYKDGPRKDLDLVFYRVRQADEIDEGGLLEALIKLGFTFKSGNTGGWLLKSEYQGKPVDMFFPENGGGDYDHGDPELDDGAEWPDNLPVEGPNGCVCGHNGDCNCPFKATVQ